METMKAVFSGEVVLETPDHGVLYTEVLEYIPKTHTLKTDVPVIIKRGGLEVKGSSLIYDTLTGRLVVKDSSTDIEGI